MCLYIVDVKKVTFFGDTKGSTIQQDHLSDFPLNGGRNAKGIEHGYQQLTTISKYTFIGSSSMKELIIESNRIKVINLC